MQEGIKAHYATADVGFAFITSKGLSAGGTPRGERRRYPLGTRRPDTWRSSSSPACSRRLDRHAEDAGRLPTTTQPTPVPTALNPDIRRFVDPRHRAPAATMPCPRCDSPAARPSAAHAGG